MNQYVFDLPDFGLWETLPRYITPQTKSNSSLNAGDFAWFWNFQSNQPECVFILESYTHQSFSKTRWESFSDQERGEINRKNSEVKVLVNEKIKTVYRDRLFSHRNMCKKSSPHSLCQQKQSNKNSNVKESKKEQLRSLKNKHRKPSSRKGR